MISRAQFLSHFYFGIHFCFLPSAGAINPCCFLFIWFTFLISPHIQEIDALSYRKRKKKKMKITENLNN